MASWEIQWKWRFRQLEKASINPQMVDFPAMLDDTRGYFPPISGEPQCLIKRLAEIRALVEMLALRSLRASALGIARREPAETLGRDVAE